MKIGLLTLHRPANFGANLQAYTTVCLLKYAGHKVKVIDYIRDTDRDYSNTIPEAQYRAHKEFVENRLPLTRQVSDEKGLIEVTKEERFDAIVIGADAVWRAPKDHNIYFGQWLKDAPELKDVRIASLSPAHMGDGFKMLEPSQRTELRKCLEHFCFKAVRDSWTAQVINDDIFGGKKFITRINTDPVVMLSQFVRNEKWISDGIESKKYYLMSLPKNWSNEGHFISKRKKWFSKFKQLVNEAGYMLIELPQSFGPSGMDFDYTIKEGLDPLQWYLWIMNAKAYCGLRFHAIVSSISSGTPFYSIDAYGDSGRASMLLDIAGFHATARKRDGRSKIYQLLSGTSMEKFRTGMHIEFESPGKVFHILENVDDSKLRDIKGTKAKVFQQTFSDLLKAISND